MSTTKKLAVVALVVAMVFGFGLVAKGQTVADLQAQISALLAQINALQAQLPASGGNTSAYSYTQDLTLGSTGADVSALQQMLITGGFLKVTAPTGYFGPMTQAALASWQASKGISPAAGYFGPKTRAFIASLSTGTVPITTFPAGCTSVVGYSPTTGLPCSGTTTTTTTTSTGTEGVLTVETAPAPGDNPIVYAGDVNDSILGLRVKAQGNDIYVQRVTLDLGTNNAIYNKIIDKISLWDGSTKLQEVALSSATVVKNGLNYQVSFSGFSVMVSKDGYKDLTVKATMKSVIDSTYLTAYPSMIATNFLKVPVNGVRAKGGSDIDLYAPNIAIPVAGRSMMVKGNLIDQSKLTISKNSNSPKSSAIVTDDDGNSLEPYATILVADFKAEKDAVTITDLTVNATGTATAQAVYLFDGQTLLGSASFSGGVTTLSNSSGLFIISKDTTKTMTFRVSYTGATGVAKTSSIAFANTTVLAQSSDGSSIPVGGRLIGSATSDTLYVSTQSPVFAFVSGTSSYSAPNFLSANGTLSGTMSFVVSAQGDDIWIPTSASSPFTVNYVSSNGIYSGVASSTSFSQPAGVTVDGGYYKIQEGTSATFNVNFTISSVDLPAVGYYYFNLANVSWAWGTSKTVGTAINYLDATIWRTPDVNVTSL